MPTINSCDYSPTDHLVQLGAPNGQLQNVSGTGTAGQRLTSNGAGMNPTWQSGGGAGFTTVVVQTFTSSGTYTPTAGMEFCLVQLVGGGGGGAGGEINSANFIGNAGGGGGYSQKVFDAATIGVSQSVNIGAGGPAGNNSNGTNGGTSSFGAFLTCSGGDGGTNFGTTISFGQGAFGGSGSGGDYNQDGGQGGPVIVGLTMIPSYTGPGGSSFFGPGGPYSSINGGSGGTGGNNAVSKGGGGSGSYGAAVPVTGGNGADGFCLITEYIS